MISRIKGTQDILDLTLLNFVLEKTRAHLASYNFSEIITPVLEPTELFKRSLGLQTDVISKQMYTLGEHHEICLRPETTASTVRAFVENNIQHTPWNVFSYGPMFRHERPQKGRWREFYQINIETIGVPSTSYDALFIKMLDSLCSQHLRIENYTLHLNFLGTPHDRAAHKQALLTFLEKHAHTLCQTCLTRKDANTLRIFDCKSPTCQELYTHAPRITDYLCPESDREWRQLKEHLDLLSVTYIEEPTLVRGLDYYNKTVFEFVSHDLGAQSAFCGGGRYDHLVKEIGGNEDQPSIGAAFGVGRLMLIMEHIKDRLPLSQPKTLSIIIPLGPEQHSLALLVADALHQHNICCTVLLDDSSLKSKMRKTNKLGAKWVILLGPEEQETHHAKLKNMVTSTEEVVAQTELVKRIS
jgi:histidyl-tRNA synthetase